MDMQTADLLVMGFDFGQRRIGVAIGQMLTQTATPLCIIPAQDGVPDWGRVDNLIREWQPGMMIVGLPLNMDGTMSEMAVAVQKFSRRLQNRYNLPVEMVDERLSSIEAQRETASEGPRRQEHLDHVAARIILETWLQDETHRTDNTK